MALLIIPKGTLYTKAVKKSVVKTDCTKNAMPKEVIIKPAKPDINLLYTIIL